MGEWKLLKQEVSSVPILYSLMNYDAHQKPKSINDFMNSFIVDWLVTEAEVLICYVALIGCFFLFKVPWF